MSSTATLKPHEDILSSMKPQDSTLQQIEMNNRRNVFTSKQPPSKTLYKGTRKNTHTNGASLSTISEDSFVSGATFKFGESNDDFMADDTSSCQDWRRNTLDAKRKSQKTRPKSNFRRHSQMPSLLSKLSSSSMSRGGIGRGRFSPCKRKSSQKRQSSPSDRVLVGKVWYSPRKSARDNVTLARGKQDLLPPTGTTSSTKSANCRKRPRSDSSDFQRKFNTPTKRSRGKFMERLSSNKKNTVTFLEKCENRRNTKTLRHTTKAKLPKADTPVHKVGHGTGSNISLQTKDAMAILFGPNNERPASVAKGPTTREAVGFASPYRSSRVVQQSIKKDTNVTKDTNITKAVENFPGNSSSILLEETKSIVHGRWTKFTLRERKQFVNWIKATLL